MKTLLFCVLVFISQMAIGAEQDHLYEKTLATKIKVAEMTARDQAIRFELMSLMKQKDNKTENMNYLIKQMALIDQKNTEAVKKMLAEGGWPTESIFGKKHCQDFWLLIQHADHDLALQVTALQLLEKSAQNNKFELKHFAYLYDRVKIHQHSPQRYGTQGNCLPNHTWQPFKIENVKKINLLRTSVGLDSIESYQKIMNEICH